MCGPRDFVNIWGQLGGHSPGGASGICGWDQGARPEPGPEVLGGRREPTSSLRRPWAAAWGGRWWVIHTVSTLFEGSPGGTAVASLQEDRIKPELQTPGCRGDAGGSRRASGVWVLREGCPQLGSFAHRLPQPAQPPRPPFPADADRSLRNLVWKILCVIQTIILRFSVGCKIFLKSYMLIFTFSPVK